MKYSLNKRVLCLILAVEMLCTPFAMARVQDPVAASDRFAAEDDALPATPQGDEVGSADFTEPDASGRSPQGADTLEDVEDVIEYHVALSFGQRLVDGPVGTRPGLARYHGRLAPETENVLGWGYRTTWNVPTSYDKGSNTVTIELPAQSSFGRLPGLEPDGNWYIYPNVHDTDSWYTDFPDPVDTLKTWSFDENTPEEYTRLNYTVLEETETVTRIQVPADALKELAKQYGGSVEVPGYEDEYGWGYVPGNYQYYIPLVAGWEISARSDITLFAMDITQEGTGDVTPVTTLYTKPFREAEDGDRLTASAYQADYMLPDPEHVGAGIPTVFTEENAFRPQLGQNEFYLRVDEDQEKVSIRFRSFEPYYQYNIVQGGTEESPVTLTATFNGETLPGVELTRQWKEDGQSVFPGPIPNGLDDDGNDKFIAQNSAAVPARAQWTVVDIPLHKVSDAADAAADPFTTVTIRLSAPNGEEGTTYHFYIERLMTPRASLNFGNTPAGMISRDTTGYWGTDQSKVDEMKAAAIENFRTTRYFGRLTGENGRPLIPGDVYYRGNYDIVTWQGLRWNGMNNYDVDSDPTAVVAYQDRAFSDPGVSFVDSEGRTVRFGDGAQGDYQTCVKRTIELSVPAGDAPLTSNGAEEKRWYTLNADGEPVLSTKEASQVLHNADGSDVVDLRGLKVLPGVYTIKYTFLDPVLKEELSISRPLVVLPIPGDVDMDGAVTIADAQLIDDNREVWEGDATQLYRLLHHRVMNVKQGDFSGAEAIRRGFRPAVAELARTDYFYPPLPVRSGEERYQRKTWDQVTDNVSGATLKLEFLGVEKGTWWKAQDGDIYTNDISGPWAANKTAGVSIVSGAKADTGTGDVFWMGVYLEDAGDLQGKEIEQLSLSLVYDSQFITPARVHAFGAADSIEGNDNKWRQLTLMGYNFNEGSKDNGLPMTIFSGYTANDYRYSYSTPARAYEQNPHYSKVIGDLERTYTGEQLNISYLKEVVFSLQGTSSINRATVNGRKYLLVLPFQLIKHPSSDRFRGVKDGENDLAQLIELSAGMRDFTLVTRSTGRALPGASASRIAWMASRMDVPAALAAAGTQTYAFSAQEEIYGGGTQNLRDSLIYQSDEASADTGLIPIGEDKTERVEFTGTYDEYLRWSDTRFFGNELTEGALPPGLSLHPTQNEITGTPTKAGTYDFTIADMPCRIIIQQKVLRYAADIQTSYYGQTEFRGSGNEYFTFHFELEDLAAGDKAKITGLTASATQGTGEHLEQALTGEGLTYKAPTFFAKDPKSSTAVTHKTGVGTYSIEVYTPPESTNYKFQYIGGAAGTRASNLSIIPRPVWIDHLTVPQDRSGASIYNDMSGDGVQLFLQEKAGEELVHLAIDPTVVPNGLYMNRPLTGSARVEGDRLALSYVASFRQTEEDLEHQDAANTYPYYLKAGQEMRNLNRVSSISFTDGRLDDLLSSPNYELQNTRSVLSDDDNDIEGTVIRRGVRAIEFSSYPSMLTYENGEPLVTAKYGSRVSDDTRLRVKVRRGGMGDAEDDTVVGSYDYNSTSLQPMEIHYNWVSKAQRDAGLADPDGELPCVNVTNWDPDKPLGQQDLLPYGPSNILTPAMDGYYLCASVRKYEAAGDAEHVTYIKAYSDNPIRVLPQDLSLSIPVRQGRYYGEETGRITYTYRLTELIAKDRSWVEAYVETYNQGKPPAEQIATNSSVALEALLTEVYGADASQLPKLVVSTVDKIPNAAQVATANTPAAQPCYLVLHGGSSDCYRFLYGTSGSEAFGYEPYYIEQRPIVVQDIFSSDLNSDIITGAPPAEGLHKSHFEAIYADTKSLYLKGYMTPDADHVTFTLPEQDAGGYYYYRAKGTGEKIYIPAQRAYQNNQSVLPQDRDKLKVSYSIRFIPDAGHYSWRTFTDNYYSVDDLNNEHDTSGHKGTSQRPVEICDLALAGDSMVAANYVLVYKTSEGAVRLSPSNIEQKNYPDPNNPGQTRPYQVHGTGTVTLRPIVDLTFDSLSRTEYLYGDSYAPQQKNPATQKGMVARVHYATTLDERHKDMANAYESETVSFSLLHPTPGVTSSTFAQRGFTIYYLKPGQTQEEAQANHQVIDSGDPMLPGEHHGAKIFIVGRRRAADEPIVSQNSVESLVVTRRVLHLTGPDGHKFYGENEYVLTDGGYTFPMSDLAPRDQEKLAELKGLASVGALPALGTQADLELLSGAAGWGFGAVVPQYTTTAVRTSPVGSCPLTMNLTNTVSNYEIAATSGALHIYPRPVTVMGVRSAQDDPIYTIYNQSTTNFFNTQLDTSRVDLVTTNTAGELAGAGLTTWGVTCADGARRELPVSGAALMDEDRLTFNVRLTFYDQPNNGFSWSLGNNESDVTKDSVRVEFNGLASGGDNANYEVALARGFSSDGLWGAMKLRTIANIEISGTPKMTGYTYGDPLDLSGLQVTVFYKKSSGEMDAEPITARYIGPDQFRSYGLYVNYWEPNVAPPTNDAERHALPSAYRAAAGGDHITIAPTKDSRDAGKPFAAQGKTLIISAFQDTVNQSAQPAAEPKVLQGKGLVYYNDGTPQTIQIAPLPLQYTLSAEDKTYDGTPQAAGTLVLQNIFNRETQVRVDQTPDGSGSIAITARNQRVTDEVYIPMGAAARPSVVGSTMTFTTGTYNGEEQFASVLNPNAAISWTPGYTWNDGLTFTFVNPNVHYLEQGETGPRAIGTEELAAYWRAAQNQDTVTFGHDSYRDVCAMPVEITGMVLQGPDAANYTWAATKTAQSSERITMTTRATAANGQAAAPYATIHKANRPILQENAALTALPTLALDLHTNIIRLGFDPNLLAALNDARDEFAGELHLEYSLFYNGADNILATWAGDAGDEGHQDGIFFGGEAVRPTVEAGYLPDLNRLPKPDTANENTIYKGQIYAWAGEDAGFALDPSAYPGGAEAAPYYWDYALYATSRTALPRDTVFYPMVRLSETHNYNPSGDLSGDRDVTARQMEEARLAADALSADPENEGLKTAAQEASAVVFASAQTMEAAARKAAQDKVAADLERSENSGRFEGVSVDAPLSASAIKTFTQRLDLLTASRERNTTGENRDTEYLVEMLESVWFTDTLIYPEVKLLDAVVGNQNPVRYYSYAWDLDRSAQLRFSADEFVDLTGDFMVSIRPKDGEEGEVNVNPADEDTGARTARLYVTTESGSSAKVRTIRIVPNALYVRLGDEPFQLGVVTTPPKPSNRRYRWSTSNAAVATVDETGLVTFRGEGEATITVTTDNGRSASILVVVSAVLPLPDSENGLFNFNFTGPWEKLGEDEAFRPHEQMTRAQVAVLMDIFLNPSAQWAATAELAYVDLNGKESYYEAVSRLTAAGVIRGVPGQAFAGDQMITRAEFTAILCRMLELEVPDTAGQLHVFEDAGEMDTWAYACIDAIAKTGVMRGVGGGNFAPERILTREEAAAVISRLLVTKLSSDQTGLRVPSDMTPANWSYTHVLRAINSIAFPD